MKATTNQKQRFGMRKAKKVIVTILLSAVYSASDAQLITGAEGIHIASGTTFTADGLWMVPSADLEISNTTLRKHSLAVSWPQLNGIRRLYVFSHPVTYRGRIGLQYREDELMGNSPTQLGLAHSAGNSTAGEQFTLVEGSMVDQANYTVSHHSVSIPELMSLTAVNPRETPGSAKALVASTILSPDDDGINDLWVIENVEKYKNNELRIFDRNGRILYQEVGYKNTWNGTVNGRLLAEDTYYYILNYDSGKKLTGFITLVRKG